MTTENQDIRLLLELHVDGELPPSDREEVERLLAEREDAREYVAAMREMRDTIRIPIEHAVEGASFDGLFARVMEDVESCSVRDAELEMLLMARADGEELNRADEERVNAYLRSTPEAQEGLQSLSEMHDLIRMPIELAADRVDFDALHMRISDAIDAVDSERSSVKKTDVAEARPSFFAQILHFFGGQRGLVSAAVAAAAVAIVMMPGRNDDTPVDVATEQEDEPLANEAGTTIINNYYSGPSVENVRYDPGYGGYFQPGDEEEDLAPVIWIAPDEKPEDLANPQLDAETPTNPAFQPATTGREL